MWQCKWWHLVAKLVTIPCSATWWPKLEPVQVAPSGGARSTNCWLHWQAMQVVPPGGRTWNQKWCHLQIDFCQKNDLRYRVNTLGPLCLWRCFTNVPFKMNQFKWSTKKHLSFLFQRLITSLFDLVRFQPFTTDQIRNAKTEVDDKRGRVASLVYFQYRWSSWEKRLMKQNNWDRCVLLVDWPTQ